MQIATTAILIAMLWAGQAPQNGMPRVFSMDEASKSAVTAKPGNVVGSYVMEGHHRTKYVFEIAAPEGTWKVKVDASTGKVIRTCLLNSTGPNGCRSMRRSRRTAPQSTPSARTSLVSPGEYQP